MPSFCAPMKTLLLLPPVQPAPSLSEWMVPGCVSPDAAVIAPRTWMNVPEPLPLLPARRAGQPVRLSSNSAGARVSRHRSSPGPTPANARRDLVGGHDQLPSPGSRLWAMVTARVSQPSWSVSAALEAGRLSSLYGRWTRERESALDGHVERPRPSAGVAAQCHLAQVRLVGRPAGLQRHRGALASVAAGGAQSVRPPDALVRCANRGSFTLRYRKAVHTPTYGCGLPSFLETRACRPANVAESATERSI